MKHILGIYISGKLWRKIHLDDYPGFQKGEPITLGRRETCDISIPQSIVSREHAHIVYDGRNTCIIDKNSLNGLDVGGRKQNRIVLKNGTTVRIGSGVSKNDSVALMYVEVDETSAESEKEEKPVRERKAPEKHPSEEPVSRRRTGGGEKVNLHRLLAAMADWTVAVFMCIGLVGISAFIFGLGKVVFIMLSGGALAIIVLYYALSESGSGGTTFGKGLFGFKVVDNNGNNISFKRALIRTVAKGLSAFTLFLPVFGRGRCLHDIIAGTKVVKVNKKD